MGIILKEQGQLSDEQIELWVRQVGELGDRDDRLDRHELTRARLQLEEVLLRARDNFGLEQTCRFMCSRSMRCYSFRVEIAQREVNLLASPDDAAAWSGDILAGLGTGLTYRYARGINRINIDVLRPRRKFTLTGQILLALLLAVLLSLLLSRSPEMAAGVNSGIIKPTLDKLIALLGTFATPMIFVSVVLAIVNMGDINSFGRVGKTMLTNYAKTYLAASIFVTLVLALLFGIDLTAVDGAGGALSQLYGLILDMIPSSLVEAFRTDNDLQVIILAVFVGVIALGLSHMIPGLIRILQELNELLNRIMLILCKLLPVIVFIGILNLSLGGQLGVLIQSWKAAVAYFLAAIFTECFCLLRARRATGKTTGQIIRPQLPSLLINLTTSSQIAALPASMKCVKEDWQVDSRLADFGVPFGMVTFMPNGAQMMISLSWVVVAMGGQQVSLVTAIMLIFVGILVAVAAPPIPGSAMIVLPICLAAVGISDQYLSAAMVMASVLGYLLPAFNGMLLQMEVLIAGSSKNKK